MIVEIRGTNIVNKGAELMLQVVLERVRAVCPDAHFAVERWFGPFEDRAKYGLQCIAISGGRRGWILDRLLPRSYREIYGVVDYRDVDMVIDASGFACGDQWGAKHMLYLAERAEDWRKRDIPTVFLPQAFGPFTSTDIRDAAKRTFENIDLVFAREKTSFDHIRNLGVQGDHLRQAHDFTNLIKGKLPAELVLPENLVCIVPNFRMLKNTDDQSGDAYLKLMVSAIEQVLLLGWKPVYLFHDRVNDEKIAKLIDQRLGTALDSLDFSCPQILKGILAQARLVVGSRFHALVGALCQGVPVIATSWSHKYEELLTEYGSPESVFSPSESDRVRQVIKAFGDDYTHESARIKLQGHAKTFVQQSEAMFDQAMQTLGLLKGGDA